MTIAKGDFLYQCTSDIIAADLGKAHDFVSSCELCGEKIFRWILKELHANHVSLL